MPGYELRNAAGRYFHATVRRRHGFKDATTDETIIRAWAKNWPGALWGRALEANVLVIDLDMKHGKNGICEFGKLQSLMHRAWRRRREVFTFILMLPDVISKTLQIRLQSVSILKQLAATSLF